MLHLNGTWRDQTKGLIVRGALALGIATTALGAMAAPARALDTDDLGYAKAHEAYNFTSENSTIRLQTASEVLPDTFDLRDRGVVTPVKFQNPWGTCWGFAAIAASETSLLSELGTTYADTGLDFSERHLAYFMATHLPDDDATDESYDGQGGEGGYNALTETDDVPNPEFAEQTLGYPLENAVYNYGGYVAYATSLFSSGIGPVEEWMAPYRNDEGVVYDDMFWSPTGTWTLDEALRAGSSAALEESFILPSPATFDENDAYVYDENATTAIKEQIFEGRAVSISFCADASKPGEVSEDAYINTETWAHYTYHPAMANHVVTIVGWDDGYSKENFNAEHQPPADGAWIAKNSWGAESNEFPNKSNFGDDGYFYLSYYDQSISVIEAFDYDVDGRETDKNGTYIVNQYDYMPTNISLNDMYEDIAHTANVFTAEDGQRLTSLSCETAQPGTTVTYEVYRLADGATDPTDGELLTRFEASYEYGGYHLEKIPAQDRGKMGFAKGDRFSVVVTMRLADDTYDILFQGSPGRQLRDLELNELRIVEDQTHAIKDQVIETMRSEYLETHPEATDAEVSEYLASQEQAIADNVESVIQTQVPIFFRSVVNEGESYLYTDGAWSDLVDKLASDYLPMSDALAYDNFSIKAYADPFDHIFTDVPADEWYSACVERAADLGLMGGYGDGTFGPNDTLVREQAAQVMWNLLGEDDTDAAATAHVDVDQGAWYADAVNWAVANDVMEGYSASDAFGVGDALTREQFCSVLAKAVGADLDAQSTESLNEFPDADGISAWARTAVAWAVDNGVIDGVETEGGRELQAAREMTRAEMAKVMVAAVDAGIFAEG